MTLDTITEPIRDGGEPRDAPVATSSFPNEATTDAPADRDDVATELTKDTLFELLKNQRRRDALDFLRTTDGQTTLSDMAEHIAAKENDLPVESINSKQRKRVYIGLYQCHLPKMADAGVVDFDKDRGTVRLCELAVQLYPYLDRDESDAADVVTDSAVDVDTDSATHVADDTTVGTLPPQSAVLVSVGVAALAGVAGVPGVGLLPASVWAIVCAVTLIAAAVVPVVRE